jgi:hypothetical protein
MTYDLRLNGKKRVNSIICPNNQPNVAENGMDQSSIKYKISLVGPDARLVRVRGVGGGWGILALFSELRIAGKIQALQEIAN